MLALVLAALLSGAGASEVRVCTDYACASIDVCASPNRGVWMHMSLPALDLAAANTSSEAVRRFDLASATVPQGVVLAVCTPDFARAIHLGEYVCDGSWASQRELLGPKTEAGLSEARGVQMLRYELAAGYACGRAAVAGYDLDPPNASLQRLLPCAEAVGHGRFDSDCVLQCDADYEARDGACEPMCVEEATACGPQQAATSSCEADTGWRYACADCVPSAGFALTPWTASTAAQCVHEACPPGSYGTDGSCHACPATTFSSGAHACTSCNTTESGFFAAPAQGSCEPCFAGGLPGPVCGVGHMLVRDFSAIRAYFRAWEVLTAFEDMPRYCSDGGACLPCPPGSSEHEGVCVACAVGSLQNGFAQTVCIPCRANQTTLQEGSAAAAQCVCESGSS